MQTQVTPGAGVAQPLVRVAEKCNLTLTEAAAYFNIGINKLRDYTNTPAGGEYILMDGTRRLIKRELFEKHLSQINCI